MRNIVKLEESGVSEVVGTILILVITVILFATVFTYVQHIPPPSKSAQLVIQSNIYGTGENISIQLKDLAGSTLNSNETYLDIFVNGTFKSFNLYSLTKKPTFGPGSYLNINLFDLGIQVNNISSLGLLIFSEQYNQILWKLNGTLSLEFIF
jgi:archaeal flagellin N-terminal-like domain